MEELKAKLLANMAIQGGPLDTPCWVWAGAWGADGYGLVKWQGIYYRVHRAMWAECNGPIPKGMWVLHRCDNPPCINPDHLWLGTDQDNSDDKFAKGRQDDRRGSMNARAILTEAEVAWIRYWYWCGYTRAQIAPRYDVSISTIGDIVYGKNWPDVPIEDPEDCPPELWPPEAKWPLIPILGLERRI